MLFKKSLRTIAYFCTIYTGIFFVLLLLFFSLLNQQNIRAAVNKNSASIENKFSILSIQYDAIYNELLDNELLEKYINNNDTYSKLKLYSALTSFANSASPSIRSISIIFDDSKTVISSRSSMTYAYFARELGLEPADLTSHLKINESSDSGNNTHFFISGDYLTISTYNNDKFNAPFYVLISYYLDYFVLGLKEENISIAFKLHDDLIYVSDADKAKAAASLFVNDKSSKYIKSKADANLSMITTPIEILCFTNRYNRTRSFVIPICLSLLLSTIILLCGLIFSNRFAKRLYQPVTTLLDKIDKNDDGIEDEFATIGKFVDEINEKNDIMQNYIKESDEVLEKQMLITALLGTYEKQNLSRLLKHRNLLPNTNNFSAAILMYCDYENLYSSISEVRFSSMKSIITNLLYEKFSEYSFFKVVNVTPDTHVLIHSHFEKDKFKEILNNAIEEIEKKLSICLIAYIGKNVYDFTDLHESYNEALFTSKCKLFQNSDLKIFTIHDVDITTTGETFIYPTEVESDLISAVNALNMGKVRQDIKMLIDVNFPSIPTNENFSLLVTMLFATISRILSEVNVTSAEVFGKDTILYLELRETTSAQELSEKSIFLIEKIVNYISSERSSKIIKIRHTIEQYVSNNYQHDISLYDISQQLNLSETYVSKTFKTIMGANFKDYLMYYKYKKAKQIMKEHPTYKMKDVAQMVGCNTTQTFSRLLKKYDSQE